MNKTYAQKSCLLPFKVQVDFGNDLLIFLFILTCLILALLFGYLLLKHKLSTADQAKNLIVLINEDIFYLYLGMLLPIVCVGCWRTVLFPIPVYIAMLARYMYIYLFFCICLLYQTSSIFKLCLIVEYERIMEFDQERLKRSSFFTITIMGGIVYTVFYCINIHRGIFTRTEAYLGNCNPGEGFDYCLIFNMIIFLLNLAVFLISNLIVRCHSNHQDGLNFSCQQYIQCSLSKTVTIGSFAVLGFIGLIVLVNKKPSVELYGNVIIYFTFSFPVAGLLLHVMKEREFTLPYVKSQILRIQTLIGCMPTQVVPELPIQLVANPNTLRINVQSINPQDDGGIFVGKTSSNIHW